MPLVPTLRLNAVQVLALGCLALLLGAALKRRLPWLTRLAIPTPIAGGMLFALLALLLHGRWLNLDFDTSLRDLLMIAFMTTIGLNARLQWVRRGGPQVVLLLAVATLGALLQDALGMGLARWLGLDPLLGVVAGSVALTGGPATAAAFGPTFERLGVAGATATGIAASIFGIAVASLIAGDIGARLVRRHRLAPAAPPAPAPALTAAALAAGSLTLLPTLLLIGIAMGAGSLISAALGHTGLLLPSYIGAMIAAALLRNLNDRFAWFTVSQSSLDQCSEAALYLFIALAVVSLQLSELAHLALPLLLLLAAQVALAWLLTVALCYPAMGSNYFAAVTASGFCGFMLGITANALASMQELVEQFAPSADAFLVVPIVGAFLIDFTNALLITGLVNWLR